MTDDAIALCVPRLQLSIVIVNWRALPFLRHSIQSIRQTLHGISYEIIVVDNNSGDGSAAAIMADFDDITLLSAEHNLGFAAANNWGYEHSRGELLLFLNPDTELRDDSIVRMVAHFREVPLTAAAGPKLLNTDGSLQDSCVQAFPTILNQFLDSELLRSLFPRSTLWGNELLFDTSKKPADVEVVSGACFMIRRRVFESVGMFTADYFMYSEDVDLSYKLWKSGYQIRYLPFCTVIHHGGRSSSKQATGFSDLWQHQSRLMFFRFRRGRIYASVYRTTQALSAIIRICLLGISLVTNRRASRGHRAARLRKWCAILRWAVGLNWSWSMPASSCGQERLR